MEDSKYTDEEVKELFDVVFKLSAKDISDKLVKVHNRPEIARRRWFWELLQNAKDAVPKGETVDVELRLYKNQNSNLILEFRHNGNPFRYEDAKNLVFPYSDKGEEEDSDKSGRFGTGFLATHILSRKIGVAGVLIRNNQPHDFRFILNRSATTKTELAEAIGVTWREFRKNTVGKSGYVYTKGFDTKFLYQINDTSLQSIRDAIHEVIHTLPYALTFISKVSSVSINDEIESVETKFSKEGERPQDGHANTKVVSIGKFTNNSGNMAKTSMDLIVCSNDNIEIATELIGSSESYKFKEYNQHQPKVFCPFPLIGANDFPFPIAINSENFTPKEERDGIWLGDTPDGRKNQEIFEDTIGLFSTLISWADTKKVGNGHVLFKTVKALPQVSDLDSKWFEEIIQNKMKSLLRPAKIVDSEKGERFSSDEVNFASNEKEEVREKLWEVLSTFNPTKASKKDEIHKWHNVLWVKHPRKITLDVLSLFVSNKGLKELTSHFEGDQNKTLEWLNSFVELIAENNEEFLNRSEFPILPNQYGVFKTKDELYLDDDSMDDEIKEILGGISKYRNDLEDWREELLDKRIFLELPETKTQSIGKLAPILMEHVKELLRSDDPDHDLQDLFSRLLNWLNENPDLRKDHFKGLKTDTLLYKSANESKLKQFTELLKKDRDGEISVEQLAQLNPDRIALLDDPQLELKIQLGEQVLEEQLKQQQEFEFKKKAGDVFEQLFKRIIEQSPGISIQKVEGEEDFIITNNANHKEFYIELKSASSSLDSIELTHLQAKKAVKYSANYILCIIPNNGGQITEDYFKEHAKIDTTIGSKLIQKVGKALAFEESESGISVLFEDNLLRHYKKYRYKFALHRDFWSQDSFQQLLDFIGR